MTDITIPDTTLLCNCKEGSPSVNTALTDLCSNRTNDVGAGVGAGVGPLTSDKSPEYCSQS